VQLITRLHLVPRLRMSGSMPLLTPCLNFVDKNNFEYPVLLQPIRRVNQQGFCNILINSAVFASFSVKVLF
jgi:hypothetical protein